MNKPFRELMARPSVFSVTLVGTVTVAVVLLGWGVSWDGWTAAALPLAVMLAGATLFEIRPLTVLRYSSGLSTNPYTIHLGQAFGFATLYVWGAQPAVVVTGLSWLIGQLALRREVWRAVFNAAQFLVCMACAGAVMQLLHDGPLRPADVLRAGDLGWVVATWSVYFVVNDILVSALYESDGSTFWRDFVDGTGWYVVAELLVDSLAIVVVVLVAAGALYPLALVVPLVLFAQTYRLTRSAEHSSLHDELTGVANRRQLLQRLADLSVRGSSYAVVLLDLDGFKSVNDQHGHQTGDRLLQAVAERMLRTVRDVDVVARLAGDEFAVVLGDRPSAAESVEIAQRVHDAIGEPLLIADCTGPDCTVQVGASVGVVTVARADALGVDEVLYRADSAMYRAKAAGGGVLLWTSQPEEVHGASMGAAEAGLAGGRAR